MAGFGWGDKPQRAGLPDSRMLAMLGALVQKTRTAEGLSRVIALAAPGVGVRVDEFWATTMPAGLARPLSSTPQAAEGVPQRGLGGGYVLGRRLSWRARVVRVTLKPQDARQAHELLPGMRVHRELMAVMQLYVGIKVDVHLRMVISSRLIPQPVVSHRRVDPSPRLGWTTVLPSEAERTIAVPLGMCKASTNTPGGTKT